MPTCLVLQRWNVWPPWKKSGDSRMCRRTLAPPMLVPCLSTPLTPLLLAPNPALKYSVMIPKPCVPQGKRPYERLRNPCVSTIRSSVARRPTALHGRHSLWTIARRGTLYVGIWDDDEDVLACEDRANHRRRGSDYYQISVADVMTRILQDRPPRHAKKGRGRRACDRASSWHCGPHSSPRPQNQRS